MKIAYQKISPAELLKINPATLRAVHNVFGIDWNKPAAVVRYADAPTRNSITKTGEEIQIPGSAVVLIHRNGKYTWDGDRRRFYCFTVSAGSIDIPEIEYGKNTGGALSKTWKKACFDEWRNDPNEKNTVYAIFQAKENRTPEKPITAPNEYTRYKNTGETGFFNGGPKSYKLRSLDSGETVKATIHYYYKNGKQTHDKPEDILDRSGYYIRNRRENLKKRAAALKAERAKNSYSNQDTAADVAEIENAATETRLFIADALRNADTATAGKIIAAIDKYWNARYAFPDAVKRMNEARNHAYKDRETADKYKADALGGLEKLLAAVAAAINPTTAEEVKTA